MINIAIVRCPTVIVAGDIRQGASAPLGLAYIVASLRKAGHNVIMIDAPGENLTKFLPVPNFPGILKQGLEESEIIARLPKNIDLIGISSMFSTEWPIVKYLIRKVFNDFSTSVKIVAGGEHITGCYEYSMKDCPELNFAILGEGEETICDLARTIESGGDYSQVKGLVWRKGEQLVVNERRSRLRDIESLPWPAWDLVPVRNYIDAGETPGINIGRSIPILASRGCPYQCLFCSNPNMWGKLWRVRPYEKVFEEMKYLTDALEVTNFDFFDLTAIVNKEWIMKFSQLIIDSGLKLTWQLPSGTRSEALDDEVVSSLYASGCRHIIYAPESGSNYMLKKIRKKISKKKMLKSVRAAVKRGIKTKVNFIVGFPDEGLYNVLQSYGFAIQLAFVGNHDVSFFPFSPYPGSELFNQLYEDGRIYLSDAYFFGLLTSETSGSQYFSSQALFLLTYIGMALFYSISFMLRPKRFFNIIKALRDKKPQTRLDASLIRLLKRKRHYKPKALSL